MRLKTLPTLPTDLIEMNQPIDVDSLVSEQKKAMIIKCIQTIGDGALTPLKNHLGNDLLKLR
ncbi:helix-turn-helix domain-containing protein [Crocosphaera sp.]|uniref:helix-turn-helix domain-containing protein n=1 Tax=Crocosphaera sp. TaxID=2729996 RepID=UPI002636FF16|nr:helix-turn-helix domain-containing protein [Crocosphaera sp.]